MPWWRLRRSHIACGGNGLSSMPNFTKSRNLLPFFILISDSWSSSCKHRAGPAHLSGDDSRYYLWFHLIYIYVPGEAARTVVVQFADEMSFHTTCALCVYAIYILSEQRLANYHLGPGDTRLFGLIDILLTREKHN